MKHMRKVDRVHRHSMDLQVIVEYARAHTYKVRSHDRF